MKELTTKRKFYNKWLYKITVYCRGGRFLKPSIDQRYLNSLSSTDLDLITLYSILSVIDKNQYGIRVEGSHVDVYSNDKDIIDTIKHQFVNGIKHIFAPADDVLINSTNEKEIISKNLPHSKYRYKVFLQPHKLKTDEEKNRYIDWIGTQSSRILITDKVKDWFKKTKWNYDRRYMYVEDEKTLLMVKMKNPEAIGTVYTFIVVDK